MKNFKFEKPFEAFNMSKHMMKPYKEQWSITLRDPAALIIFFAIPILCIVLAIIFQ